MATEKIKQILSMSIHIRKATPEDIDTLLTFIKELALYEKSPESVKATPEILRQSLFGETPYAHAIIAVSGSLSDPGEPIGMALYFYNFSTWTGRPGIYLEDLYVREAYRNRGIGKALFGELGSIALEKGCERLDWAVLKWNTPSIMFYEKVLGASAMTEWEGMRLEREGIAALSKFRIDSVSS